MNPPIETARLFAGALLLGCGVGLWYGFLRPLRPRWLGDLLFLPGLFWAWIYHSFALCGGDIRMGHALGILLGALVWDATVGKLLRPVFTGFWNGIRRIFVFFLFPVKFFMKKSREIRKIPLVKRQKNVYNKKKRRR